MEDVHHIFTKNLSKQPSSVKHQEANEVLPKKLNYKVRHKLSSTFPRKSFKNVKLLIGLDCTLSNNNEERELATTAKHQSLILFFFEKPGNSFLFFFFISSSTTEESVEQTSSSTGCSLMVFCLSGLTLMAGA